MAILCWTGSLHLQKEDRPRAATVPTLPASPLLPPRFPPAWGPLTNAAPLPLRFTDASGRSGPLCVFLVGGAVGAEPGPSPLACVLGLR